MNLFRFFSLLSTCYWLSAAAANVAPPNLKPEEVHTASNRKLDFYVHDGVFVGGDKAVEDVVLLDVRHAVSKGFERVVVDVEGNKKGDPTLLSKSPYFHISVSPEMKRVVVTIWGSPKLAFDSKRILKAFQKSKIVQSVDLLPVVEKDRWSFVMNLSQVRPVEVFELGSPTRIVLDLKSAP